MKAAAFDEEGRLLGSRAFSTPTVRDTEGFPVYAAGALWEQLAAALRALSGDLSAGGAFPAALGLAGMAESGVLLDRGGRPVLPIWPWFDTRGLEVAYRRGEAWAASGLDGAAVFRLTGLRLSAKPTLMRLLWARERFPEAWARVRRWVGVPGYVAWRLTGEIAIDPSQACRTMAFDLHARAWSSPMLEAAGLPVALWPTLAGAGEVIGRVTPEASRATGLPAGIPVVPGGHDHLVAAVATGITEPDGSILDSCGTAEALLTVISRRPPGDGLLARAYRQGYSVGCHAVQGRWYAIGGMSSSGGAVEWWLRQTGMDYAAFTADLETSGPAEDCPLFVPHLAGSAPPAPDPGARGAFVALRAHHTRADLSRAVAEGVALEIRRMLDGLGRLTGRRPRRLVAVGGSTRNEPWMALRAAAVDVEIAVPAMDEAAALGAAMLAARGVGATLDPKLEPATVYRASPGERARAAALLSRYARAYASLSRLEDRRPAP